MTHLRLFRADKELSPAGLYAPLLIPHHAYQSHGMGDLDGLFSKLVKAVAKPFQKIFPAKTLLGKVMDPLGLTDPKRNLNLVGRVADVVGTAAAVVAGGWAVGAASAGTAGGFWATAATGAKVAGAAAMKAGSWLTSGIGTVAKTAAPLLLTGSMGGANPGVQADAIQAPQQGLSYMTDGMSSGAWDASGMAASGGGGGGGSWSSSPEAQTMPGATVEVTDTAPEGPNWLLIGGAALAVFLLVGTTKKGGKNAR